MTRKLVLDVGNCGPDHSSIRRMLQSRYDVEVLQADNFDDAIEVLRTKSVALVTVNRKLDCDYSDGMEVLKQIKADSQVSAVPVMLVTNYPEHQQAAVDLGAEWGFGKLQLETAQTHERLARFLDPVSRSVKA